MIKEFEEIMQQKTVSVSKLKKILNHGETNDNFLNLLNDYINLGKNMNRLRKNHDALNKKHVKLSKKYKRLERLNDEREMREVQSRDGRNDRWTMY